jgi:hypothetical protein
VLALTERESAASVGSAIPHRIERAVSAAFVFDLVTNNAPMA